MAREQTLMTNRMSYVTVYGKTCRRSLLPVSPAQEYDDWLSGSTQHPFSKSLSEQLVDRSVETRISIKKLWLLGWIIVCNSPWKVVRNDRMRPATRISTAGRGAKLLAL